MKIISRYKHHPPHEQDWENDQRSIRNGPLYPASEVLGLLKAENIKVMTRKAITDVATLGFDAEDIADLLEQALKQGRYLASEWTKLNEIACAACDAYRLIRTEEINQRLHNVAYYLKFAINDQGVLVLLVSCHLSK